jgi:hypothetical protein
MRTKILTAIAAIGIFGATSLTAQVYSQNSVGFYTLNLVPGFNLIANQLNNGDNVLDTIIPATSPLPDGSFLLPWDVPGQTFGAPSTFFATIGWYEDDGAGGIIPSTYQLNAGTGAFLNVNAATDIVLVGEVPQGALTQDLTAGGFQIVSQLTPQSIGFEATGFPAGDGDFILFWNPSPPGYQPPITYFQGIGWFDDNGWYTGTVGIVDPAPAIGQAVFYNRGAASGPATWTRDFSVNP